MTARCRTSSAAEEHAAPVQQGVPAVPVPEDRNAGSPGFGREKIQSLGGRVITGTSARIEGTTVIEAVHAVTDLRAIQVIDGTHHARRQQA